MDKIKNVEKTEKELDRIKEIFKESISGELYDTWADTFDIDVEDEKQVVVTYHGTESFKKFKQECREILVFCI